MTLATKPKRPIHSGYHKKVHGLHQKRNDQFLKHYWPYLPMLITVAVGLAILGALMIGPLGALIGGGSVTFAGIVLSL